MSHLLKAILVNSFARRCLAPLLCARMGRARVYSCRKMSQPPRIRARLQSCHYRLESRGFSPWAKLSFRARSLMRQVSVSQKTQDKKSGLSIKKVRALSDQVSRSYRLFACDRDWYPPQSTTGSRGYLGKLRSTNESWHRMKTDPRSDCVR
jgi:hypothetical protein